MAKKKSRKTGTCPDCGYKHRLRKDGTLGKHDDCKGVGKKSVENGGRGLHTYLATRPHIYDDW